MSELYLKRILNIKSKSKGKGLLSKGRKRLFYFIDIILLLFFACSLYVVGDNLVILPVLLFFALINFFRGIEEKSERESEKGHYHEWLYSIMFMVMFFFALVSQL